MQAQYDLLQEQMNELQSLLTDLQQRDDNLYRVIFQPTLYCRKCAIAKWE